MYARLTVRTPAGERTFTVQTDGQYRPSRLGVFMSARVVDGEGCATDPPHVILAAREDVLKIRELEMDHKYGTLRQKGVVVR